MRHADQRIDDRFSHRLSPSASDSGAAGGEIDVQRMYMDRGRELLKRGTLSRALFNGRCPDKDWRRQGGGKEGWESRRRAWGGRGLRRWPARGTSPLFTDRCGLVVSVLDNIGFAKKTNHSNIFERRGISPQQTFVYSIDSNRRATVRSKQLYPPLSTVNNGELPQHQHQCKQMAEPRGPAAPLIRQPRAHALSFWADAEGFARLLENLQHHCNKYILAFLSSPGHRQNRILHPATSPYPTRALKIYPPWLLTSSTRSLRPTTRRLSPCLTSAATVAARSTPSATCCAPAARTRLFRKLTTCKRALAQSVSRCAAASERCCAIVLQSLVHCCCDDLLRHTLPSRIKR